MHEDDITKLVAKAIGLALELSFSNAYTEWAFHWLDGSDRTWKAAYAAHKNVRQWADFAGDSWASRCLSIAADAAMEQARGHVSCAKSSAESAIRCAGYYREPPRESDGGFPQDELVIGDEEFSPGPIVEPPGRFPRTKERLD